MISELIIELMTLWGIGITIGLSIRIAGSFFRKVS